MASTVRVAETNPAAQLQARQEKPVPIVDSTAQFLAPLEKLGCNRTAATTGRSMDCIPPTNSGHHVTKKPNKVRAVKVSTNSEDTSKASMKKLKKLEPELAETQVHSQRVPIQLVTEKQNFPSFWMTQA